MTFLIIFRTVEFSATSARLINTPAIVPSATTMLIAEKRFTAAAYTPGTDVCLSSPWSIARLYQV
ncbi:hypothetical protein H6F93_05900 [Leptolyngbya sp. FACHB-671]|uniref:hypothetical protein n=1 Tax=Leptolyngbya sp. FACHB-671 TaxID=2692812 RepID=UPI001681D229|nr:hypothetical protein [Leptolyngbya sp. FACHB-671]MBD2067065.1 hypothetical protein [Leptolyngbya sp. FACHB-671]